MRCSTGKKKRSGGSDTSQKKNGSRIRSGCGSRCTRLLTGRRVQTPRPLRGGAFLYVWSSAPPGLYAPHLDCFVCGDGQTDDMGVVSARRGEHLDYPAGADGLT